MTPRSRLALWRVLGLPARVLIIVGLGSAALVGGALGTLGRAPTAPPVTVQPDHCLGPAEPVVVRLPALPAREANVPVRDLLERVQGELDAVSRARAAVAIKRPALRLPCLLRCAWSPLLCLASSDRQGKPAVGALVTAFFYSLEVIIPLLVYLAAALLLAYWYSVRAVLYAGAHEPDAPGSGRLGFLLAFLLLPGLVPVTILGRLNVEPSVWWIGLALALGGGAIISIIDTVHEAVCAERRLPSGELAIQMYPTPWELAWHWRLAAAVRVLPALAARLPHLITGIVVAEAALDRRNGISALLLDGLRRKDLPGLMAGAFWLIVIVAVLAALLELTARLLDPRPSLGEHE